MSSTLTTPPDEDEAPSLAADAAVDAREPVLIPVLGPRWALSVKHLAVTAAFCALFVFLNHLPLRGTDLWGHLGWGRWVLENETLPTQDPLQPLAAGMKVVDLSWGAQVIFAAAERFGGPEALVGLFTLVVWSTYVLIARTCHLQTRHALFSTIVTAAALYVGWSRIATIRPENFALLLFTCLLWLYVGRRVRRADSVLADDTRGDWKLWLGVPAIFAAWANLHGSFLCGLALVGGFFAGRVAEVLWSERSVAAVFADREARRLLYWCELAAAAVLINPYTIDAYVEVLRFSGNANLREIMEWAPLSLASVGGPEFACACLATAALLKLSRKPWAASDVILLVFFGLAAALQLRMIGWFAAVWAVAIAPHAWDVVAAWFAREIGEPAEAALEGDDDGVPQLAAGHSFRYTLGCVGLIWIAFAFSSVSRPLLGGPPRSPEAVYGESPLKLTAWLRENPPQGAVFNPQYWGDWLAVDGPPGIQVFATTNIHLIPRMTWQDYGRVASVTSGWDATLARYNVQTIIVDKARQAGLIRAVRGSGEWIPVYEDAQAQVFRKKPKSEPAKAEAASKPAACH